MSSTLEIRVNGQVFTQFETATLRRSIDENAGQFRFTSSNTDPADYPVKAGDNVQILINGTPRLTGFAERVSGTLSAEEHTISIEGRDNTCDLIDSTLPDAAKNVPDTATMQSLCETVIAALGANIEVRNDIGQAINIQGNDAPFGGGQVAADSGKTCMSHLVSFARKQQVYLVTDGQGRLLVYRPGRVRASTDIIHERGNPNNNIKNYSVTFAHNDRFNIYKTTSQDNFSFLDSDEEDSTNRSGTATDPVIRASRYLEFQAEESMTDSQSGNRAVEELNVRKARSTEYKCTLPVVAQNNQQVWDFGQLVNVKDDRAGLRGLYLVREAEYSLDVTTGTKCTLTLVPPEAYNVQPERARDRRRALQGDTLQTTEPPATRRRSR